ncbi:MAG TPA: pantetheine-phosphate adenylyltransferase [Candidatus Hydrogenedentes bacterium]|nr:pantetheine-phosphate adenylyltransferase [Candidatus Hydrogenedentota bacterium]HOL76617.1 pantetheine-phosphate adenylyltransferase [Candidatus Hydrogenedentota bacterium]HPO84450.1 pantetheine-phosphate adenylyltransferase [Candidatus Hydrogenedentota bacterium]
MSMKNENQNQKAAIYPGSFDPPTYGHLDLIQRALRLFDYLVVAVAKNDAKLTPLFPVEERIEMLRELTQEMPQVEVTAFDGLTADFARQRKISHLVRGLRAISDYEFEFSLAIINQRLNSNIDTVCLMPSEPYLFLSSRWVREVARFGGDLSQFVPPFVEKKLRQKFGFLREDQE